MKTDELFVLVVVKNPVEARLLKKNLEREGAAVTVTDNPSNALMLVSIDAFSAIILDTAFHEEPLEEILKKFIESAPSAPLFLLSSSSGPEISPQVSTRAVLEWIPRTQVKNKLLAKLILQATYRNRAEVNRRAANTLLNRVSRRLQRTLDTMVEGYLGLDAAGRILETNKAAEQLFNRPGKELRGLTYGVPVTGSEPALMEILLPGTRKKRVEMRVSPLRENGKLRYAVFLLDITEVSRLREELRAYYLIDELTQLYNRRGFFALAEQQYRILKRTGREMMAILVDVKGMRQINATHGRSEGDGALIETADILRRTFRDSDIIARIGGDEFAVLALEARKNTEDILRKRLKDNLAILNRSTPRAYPLQLNIGIAYYDPEHPKTLDQLLADAESQFSVEFQNLSE